MIVNLDLRLSSQEHRTLALALARTLEHLADVGDEEDIQHLAYRATAATNQILYRLAEQAEHRRHAKEKQQGLDREFSRVAPHYAPPASFAA